jgi:hypothetical protein
VAPVEHIGDVVYSFGARGGVAGGGAQVDVTEPGRVLVDGDAGLEAVAGPEGAEGVGVREPVRDAGDDAVAAHEPVHGDGRQRERRLGGVAAEADEQGMLVE